MKTVLVACWLISLCQSVCSQMVKTNGDDPKIACFGRTLAKSGHVELISSASYAEFQFSGDSCIISMTNQASPGEYNYIAVEIDNEYRGRIKIANLLPAEYSITAPKKKAAHLLRIYKATEAQTGLVFINYIKAARLKHASVQSAKSIEFIGNSITCGFGADDKEIPCNNGSKWYDQHNAYWSYAPRVARALHADFMLSAISGAGIYRNWNSDGPTVPQQYESAYLNIDSGERWDFSKYVPAVVVIALGTNDVSAGDGKTPRRPFDSATFVDTYVKFLKTVYGHYPATQVVLITSPMVGGDKAVKLLSCLKSVGRTLAGMAISPRRIKIFQFNPMQPSGCDGHPSLQQHEEMANEFLPFLRQVLQELN